jgi:hypothetical protein
VQAFLTPVVLSFLTVLIGYVFPVVAGDDARFLGAAGASSIFA